MCGRKLARQIECLEGGQHASSSGHLHAIGALEDSGAFAQLHWNSSFSSGRRFPFFFFFLQSSRSLPYLTERLQIAPQTLNFQDHVNSDWAGLGRIGLPTAAVNNGPRVRGRCRPICVDGYSSIAATRPRPPKPYPDAAPRRPAPPAALPPPEHQAAAAMAVGKNKRISKGKKGGKKKM